MTITIPVFCPECGDIHKIVPNMSYPTATVVPTESESNSD